MAKTPTGLPSSPPRVSRSLPRRLRIWDPAVLWRARNRAGDPPMAMLEFNEGATRQIQRLYSTPDIVEQREQVLALLSPQPGERILDVGSGPGFLVASMADAVGNRGAVHGLDASAPMNAVARELAASRPWVSIDT